MRRRFPWRADDPDVFQEGCIGLLKAARAYKPELGFKFSTFAERPIRWAIGHYLHREKKLRLVPEKRAGRAFGPAAEDPTTALPARAEAEPAYETPELAGLAALLGRLTDRERRVLELRYADEATLDAVGGELGVTKERVRQIQNQALAKCRSRAQADPALARLFHADIEVSP
jgi:RNA polymerase primary sigma factor